MGRTAFIFPGQGSQYVGMGKRLWDGSDEVRLLYRTASEKTGLDLAGLSFEGPADDLDSDVTAQLAVYVCNEACRITTRGMGLLPDVVTGYSLGFYSALVAASCLEFQDGLDAVKKAGELAVEESLRKPGGMAAVIGLSVEDAEALCRDAAGAGEVFVSNVNAARQVLVSGSVAGVARAVELAMERGALKAYVLGLGAAYHSPLMDGVAEEFSRYMEDVELSRPSVPVMSYLDARCIEDVDYLRTTVGGQIARRVLWKDTVQTMIADGVDRFIEAGPGEALTRMVRWIDRGVSAVSMESLLDTGGEESIRGVAGEQK